MPRYAPELCASVIDQYLHTDKSVELIAQEHEINERDVTRIRHAAGVPPRGARVRSLPPAMTALAEARALLRAPADDGGRKLIARRSRARLRRMMRAAQCAALTAPYGPPLVVGGSPPSTASNGWSSRSSPPRRPAARSSACCRVRRAMRSAARARSPFSPKPFRRWPACAAARRPKDYAMTTTFPQTSMSSVATLRAALTRSSQAGDSRTRC